MQNALKTYTRQLIAAVGGLDAAASCCRVNRASLGNYQDRNSDQHMPIDVVLALELVAGDPIVTRAMASLQGFSVARPEASAAHDIGKSVAAVAREAGETSARFMEANADGAIDPQERAELMRHADSLRAAADAMAAALGGPVEAVVLPLRARQ